MISKVAPHRLAAWRQVMRLLALVFGIATLPVHAQTARFVGIAPEDGAAYWPREEAPATPKSPAVAHIAFATASVKTGAPRRQVASFEVTDYAEGPAPTASLHYGLSYSLGSINCTVHTSTSEYCTVGIYFNPTFPGMRKDALVLSAGTKNLVTVPLSGTGQAPQAALNPGVVTQIPFPDSTSYAYSSAIAEDNTVYILAILDHSVYRYTKAEGFALPPFTLAKKPNSIAIDGAGTLYFGVNDYGNQILTYSADGIPGSITVQPPSPYMPCQQALDPPLEYLFAATVDAKGNLFAIETLCNQIFELTPDGQYLTTPVDPSMPAPSDITVDDAGAAFVGGEIIDELFPSRVETEINAVGASDGLAIDASGILYATRYFAPPSAPLNVGVAELLPSNYGTATIGLEPGNEFVPLGLGLGPDGTVYVGDYTNLDIVDRNSGLLTFSDLNLNTETSVQSVQLVNIGNAPLTLSSFTLIDDAHDGYALVASSPPACNKGLVLAPGTYCQVSVNLTPAHAGDLNASVMFKTNSLNTATSQTVALTGSISGPYVSATPAAIAFGSQPVDTTISQAVTLTSQGVGFYGGASLGTPTSSNPAVLSASLGANCASLAIGASCPMTVRFRAGTAGNYSATITIPLSGSGASYPPIVLPVTATAGVPAIATTTNLVASANPSTYGQSVSFTATVKAASGVNPVNGVTFKNGTSLLGVATLTSGVAKLATTSLPVGTHSITAEYTGSGTEKPSTSAVTNEIVEPAATATSVTSSANPVAAQSAVTFTARVSSSAGTPTGAVEFLNDNQTMGTGNLSGGKATYTTSGLSAGTHSIQAVFAGDSDFSKSHSSVLSQKIN